ncbi:hypothetical protein IFM89_004357 [Coptis chinensis]|uniref:DNA-directed RNA polymerase n=1 Tax=Coptis chinensis TaxID=261450 RepID=A0A835M6X5_9MAGN|nr:hypothetical protein IFM89_004357 [Coptis chinensis]
MAVHIPLSLEAQAEARLLMFSHMNLLSPAIGDPISASNSRYAYGTLCINGRLVEVVQHIVVHRTDCGTAEVFHSRCIAIRNQDIGVGLVNRFITFRAQPISIRTPLLAEYILIRRLCYGRSSTHGDWLNWEKLCGIIMGQSIGEPGTQLTLRTFHTGGVFTGDASEHIRAPR